MLYINDTNPVSPSSIVGIQGLIDANIASIQSRAELQRTRGQILLLKNPRELVYCVTKHQRAIGYVRLTKINEWWAVSEIQLSDEFRGRGIMTEVFLTILDDVGYVTSNSVQNSNTKSLYLRFVEKHPTFSLFSINLEVGEVTPFDYANPDQYWDGRKNIRIMIKPTPVTPQVVPGQNPTE